MAERIRKAVFRRLSAVLTSAALPSVLLAAVLLSTLMRPLDYEIRLLYAVADAHYDPSAVQHLRQTLVAGVRVDVARFDRISPLRLSRYDAVYLDPALAGTNALAERIPALRAYVRGGGHLFLENDLLPHVPADLLGGDVTRVRAGSRLDWTYPETDPDAAGLQDVVRRFAADVESQIGVGTMLPGFDWGYGLLPREGGARSLVDWNGVSLFAVHRYGRGTVFAASAFLPNRYYPTGYDLVSGFDEKRGFAATAEKIAAAGPKPGAIYFDRQPRPPRPYFHFAFATANALLRSEYAAFVFKSKYGFAVRKVLGPYGRPAMAYQNHFEAMEGFRDREAIRWTELLREYDQIPSFSLIRAAFTWYRWTETVVVHLNEGTREEPKFAGEFPNSFYGSGTYLLSGGQKMTAAPAPVRVPLAEPVDTPYRAAPAFLDADGDGRDDLLAGSSDGTVLLYRNLGRASDRRTDSGAPQTPVGVAPPDAFAPAETLVGDDGAPLRVESGFAAPAAVDLDGDGRPELLIGSADGFVRVSRRLSDRSPNGAWSRPEPLAAEGEPVRAPGGYAVPAIGDLDGDGVPDLVVGGADGRLTWFPGRYEDTGPGALGPGNAGRGADAGSADGSRADGRALRFGRGRTLADTGLAYVAPAVGDLDGDGRAELIVGNREGDLVLYEQEADGVWTARGPIEGDSPNAVGTHALVGGRYSAPLVRDANGDGRPDLVVGQLEYGPAVALDDPAFPYRAQLDEFLAYAREHRLELIPHLFTHHFRTANAEREEIALHRQMFRALGIPWELTGANQHTWRVNAADPLQTFRVESEAGIWFNFGFRSPGAPDDPAWGSSYLWGMPFLLEAGGLNGPMVLHTPVRGFGNGRARGVYESYVRFDLPIDYFEHVEYHFPDRVGELLAFVRELDRIRDEADYNFVSEPQLARSALTALLGDVRVRQPLASWVWDRLRDLLRGGFHFNIRLVPDTRRVPAELAGGYRDAPGVSVEPGTPLAGYRLDTDSPIYARMNGKLYVGLPRPAGVGIGWGPERAHLVRCNVPFRLAPDESGGTRIFLDGDGIQQIKLYSPRPLDIAAADADAPLKIETSRSGDGYAYVVTHFGGPVALRVSETFR